MCKNHVAWMPVTGVDGGYLQDASPKPEQEVQFTRFSLRMFGSPSYFVFLTKYQNAILFIIGSLISICFVSQVN